MFQIHHLMLCSPSQVQENILLENILQTLEPYNDFDEADHKKICLKKVYWKRQAFVQGLARLVRFLQSLFVHMLFPHCAGSDGGGRAWYSEG